MSTVGERANTLGQLVQDIVKQFQRLHDVAACGQHTNLGHQDLRIVEHLGKSGPQMMRSLAEHLGLAVNSMTSLIDHLEQKGIVHRMRSEVDRRVINVALTETGQTTFQTASHAKFQFHQAVLSALTDDEQEILLVLFRKIAREGWQQVQKFSN